MSAEPDSVTRAARGRSVSIAAEVVARIASHLDEPDIDGSRLDAFVARAIERELDRAAFDEYLQELDAELGTGARRSAVLAQDLKRWMLIEFLSVATQLGLLGLLNQPRSTTELGGVLGGVDADLLGSMLSVGVALGELRGMADGRWELRGERAKAMLDPAMDGWAALVAETAGYDADVYRCLPARLRGAPPGDYLGAHAPVLARASRTAEPVLADLVREVVRRAAARRVLDIGCGTAVHLRHAANASPDLTGVGIDIHPEVALLGQRNLHEWGLDARFAVVHADVRTAMATGPQWLAGPWDVVLLLQNIYYFPTTERVDLLAELRRLAPHGVVVMAAVTADSGDPFAVQLDLMLRSTSGRPSAAGGCRAA
jgi:predicted O-methyltransferase YrrM